MPVCQNVYFRSFFSSTAWTISPLQYVYMRVALDASPREQCSAFTSFYSVSWLWWIADVPTGLRLPIKSLFIISNNKLLISEHLPQISTTSSILTTKIEQKRKWSFREKCIFRKKVHNSCTFYLFIFYNNIKDVKKGS